jgi:hypothetical protein
VTLFVVMQMTGRLDWGRLGERPAEPLEPTLRPQPQPAVPQ